MTFTIVEPNYPYSRTLKWGSVALFSTGAVGIIAYQVMPERWKYYELALSLLACSVAITPMHLGCRTFIFKPILAAQVALFALSYFYCLKSANLTNIRLL